jgi:hypothetical protein
MLGKWIKWQAEDRAQAAFEYMLVVGAIVVVAVIAFVGIDSVIAEMAGVACPAVDTLASTKAGECVVTATPGP